MQPESRRVPPMENPSAERIYQNVIVPRLTPDLWQVNIFMPDWRATTATVRLRSNGRADEELVVDPTQSRAVNVPATKGGALFFDLHWTLLLGNAGKWIVGLANCNDRASSHGYRHSQEAHQGYICLSKKR